MPILAASRREIVIRRRVLLRARFWRHFAMYAAVFIVLWGANLWMIRDVGMMRPEKWWAFWPTFGWGFGVVTHGFSVLLSTCTTLPFVSLAWEEKRVQESIDSESLQSSTQ